MSLEYDVLIIGGGAAGLMCAASLALRGVSNIAVIERNDRVGKKLLMTGNGRCNVTNTSAVAGDYNTDDQDKLSSIFEKFGISDTMTFFEDELKVKLTDKGDLIYPRTLRSNTVLDSLRFYCEDHGVAFITDTLVREISADNVINGSYKARYIVISTGGASYPVTGSDGNSYKFINSVIHDNSAFAPVCPGLVPLMSSDKDIKALSGSKAHARIRLFIDRKECACEEGELLFTDYGISGICVMQLSSVYNIRKLTGLKDAYVLVDLLPELSAEEAKEQIDKRLSSSSQRSVAEQLSGLLPINIAEVVSKRKGDLLDNIRNFRIDISGSLDMVRAQVTIGGIKLSALNDGMSLRKRDDIYVIGEAVNVDGPCGGYNLQWAWTSAFAAADDISKRLS